MGRIALLSLLIDEEDLKEVTMDAIASHLGFARCTFGVYAVFIRPEAMSYALTLELGQAVMTIMKDMLGDDFDAGEDDGITTEVVWACDELFKEKLGDNMMSGGELLARYLVAMDVAARTTTVHPETKEETGPRELVIGDLIDLKIGGTTSDDVGPPRGRGGPAID